MNVLVCVASSEAQHVAALRSCEKVKRYDGDGYAIEWRKRGDVAREDFVESFLEAKNYDAILMLDGDQRHPEDLLAKLRIHMENGCDMVCAHYYLRSTKQIQSLCYELGDGTWPFIPYLDPPKKGLHEIAMTGLGCVLIHRRVVEAVSATLPKGMSPVAIAPMPDIEGDYGNWGPDFRFFILARRLGFKLWLDASVESLHATNLWLGHKSAEKLIDYHKWANGAHDLFNRRLELHGVNAEAFRQRKRILEARQRGFMAEAETYQNRERTPEEDQEFAEVSIAIYEMGGRLKEVESWIGWNEKYPKIEIPSDLPTTENTPSQPEIVPENETRAARDEHHKANAMDLIGQLPDVEVDGNGRGG